MTKIDIETIDKATAVYKTNVVELCKFQLERISSILKSLNVNMPAYTPEVIEKLYSWEPHEIESLNFKLTREFEHLSIVKSLKCTHTRNVTKEILSFSHLKVSSDFLNKIEEDDIIEVYDMNHVQIYRNIRFYTTTTYLLSELLIFPWMELYFRSSHITDKICESINTIINSMSAHQVVDLSTIPPHYIKEVKADPIQLCEVTLKHMAPIMDLKGKQAGYIVRCGAKSLVGQIDPSSLTFI